MFIRIRIALLALLTAGCGAAAAQDVCPADYGAFPMDQPPLTCVCSAEQAKSGTVYGANPYWTASSLCAAALHAGVIGTGGGSITVAGAPKVPFFPSVMNNDVNSMSGSASDGFVVSTPGGQADPGIAIDGPAITMRICPNNYSSFPMEGSTLQCACSAEQAKDGTVYGANPYWTASSLCRSAVHSGAIGASGGQINVKAAPKVSFFPSVTKNDVSSMSGSGDDGFEVVVAKAAPAQSAGGQAPAGDVMTMDVCPNDYGSFPMDGPTLQCACSADQTKEGMVYGANPYWTGSSLCRSAVHAGAISAAGGQIKAVPSPKVAFFPSVTKNDVSSMSGSGDDGFAVIMAKAAAPPAPAVDQAGAPIQAPIASTLKETGRVQLYVNFATDKSDPLPSSAPVLAELLQTLRDDPQMRLELIGHTDSQGGADYNRDLSERRAASIYLFLIQSGIENDRLRASGHGLTEPIATNDTAEGRALNRRVEAKTM